MYNWTCWKLQRRFRFIYNNIYVFTIYTIWKEVTDGWRLLNESKIVTMFWLILDAMLTVRLLSLQWFFFNCQNKTFLRLFYQLNTLQWNGLLFLMRRGLYLSKKHPLMGSTVMEELKRFRRHWYWRNASFYKSQLKQEMVHPHCITRLSFNVSPGASE